jgi:hypothetical protein
MATNRQLINQAMILLGVIDPEQTLQPVDAQLGLEELNNLMTDMVGEGIDLGFPPQDSLNDEFPLDDVVYGQVKPILAIYLKTSYPSAAVTPELSGRASSAKERLRLAAVLSTIQEADMRNLPRGSANTCGHNDIYSGN